MTAAAAAAPAAPPAAPTRAAPPEAPPELGAASTEVASSREMLDIEARVLLQVQDVRRAVRQLRDLAARSGGVVTEERFDGSAQHGAAELTVRVPSRAAQAVFQDLEGLGSVLNQSVTARDIGKEFFDANLRLSSLTATLQRYEQVLARATKVEEILRIEQELARVRSEIEQVKGNLRWLADRAARATVHVSLQKSEPEIVISEEPQAKFFPGLRAPLLLDLGQKDEPLHYGGGISLRFMRQLSVDLDIVQRRGSDQRGPSVIVATLGGEVHSALLGDGRRRFLNPYLGLRAGYGRFDGEDQVVLGPTVGLELYKSSWLQVDLDTRHYLAFGDRSSHYVLVPALAANIAF